jgi:2-dehydropantoate 2-reductase
MRISILGAGAIGCYFAAQLQASGADVEVIARGATLDAIRAHGITIEGQTVSQVRVPACAIEDARTAEILISCVKAYAIPGLGRDIARLVTADGMWLCTVNGLPWWYGDTPLNAVDPGGRIRAQFPIARAAGCVAYLASEITAPGVVSFNSGKGLIVGMADSSSSSRLESVARILTDAGIATTTTNDIGSAVWNNVGLNPMSALTGCTVDQILADPELKDLLVDVITEAMTIARAEAAVVESDAERRVAFMARLGSFRPSMLQDAQARRPLELDAILGAVLEIAARRRVDMPASRRLYAIAAPFARSQGLMPV